MNNLIYVGQPGKSCLHGEKSTHLNEISESILIETICFYKVKYTILTRSHSGETSHMAGTIFLLQTVPNPPVFFARETSFTKSVENAPEKNVETY